MQIYLCTKIFYVLLVSSLLHYHVLTLAENLYKMLLLEYQEVFYLLKKKKKRNINLFVHVCILITVYVNYFLSFIVIIFCYAITKISIESKFKRKNIYF